MQHLRKLRRLADLLPELAVVRAAGRKLVFTNGVFDLLHPGHVELLERARALGDLLVVGLNSDASARSQGKGDDRPIRDERVRARMLGALEAVDYVVLFDEPSVYSLIEQLQPDVLVKGGDYSVEEVVGHDLVRERGGKVVVIELVESFSTTSELERIRASVDTRLEEYRPTLDAIADALIACFRERGGLYIFGNGGSAAHAQHIAAELVGRFKKDRRPLPAVALTTDSSALTAIGNDFGFEQVFSRQLEALLREGDTVWALSTSGNSPNVIAAIEIARSRNAKVIGFTGARGGKLSEMCTFVFRAPYSTADRIQEAHSLAYHYICERVEDAFAAPGA
jgi:D-sedoheptulose 7-phosphate isomerase